MDEYSPNGYCSNQMSVWSFALTTNFVDGPWKGCAMEGCMVGFLGRGHGWGLSRGHKMGLG